MKRTMNILKKFTLGICSLGLLAGCGDNDDHSKVRKSGFVYCGLEGSNTFNPQLVDSGITSEALSPQLFDTLIKLDEKTYKLSQMSLRAGRLIKTAPNTFFILIKAFSFNQPAGFLPPVNSMHTMSYLASSESSIQTIPFTKLAGLISLVC